MKNLYKLSIGSNRALVLVIFTFLFAGKNFISSQSGTPLVVFPNGGQTLTVGSTVIIQWSGTVLNSIVGIDYTIDNWTTTTWLTTSYSNASANTYTWVVPNTPGTQCKIGIFNTSFQGDISDNFFTIAASSSVVPIADFDFSGIPCTEGPISFVDQSSNGPTSWSWAVAPSASISSSSTQNPVIKFPAAGVYTITLIPSNLNGFGAAVSKTISIKASPTVSVSSSDILLCTGNSATLSATGANTYNWSTSVSNSSIVVNPLQTSTYMVIGIASNGCKSTALFTQSVSACTGLSDSTLPENQISIYPNPSDHFFFVQVEPLGDKWSLFLELYNELGKLVEHKELREGINSIETGMLVPGIYYLKIQNEFKILKSEKLLVQ